MNQCNNNCNQGRNCKCGECAPLSLKEYIGAMLVIVICTALTVLSIIGGATWLYGTLGAL